MPPAIAAIAQKLLSFFKDMWDNTMMIYGEKGIEPFKKPLIVAVPTLIILYAAVYSPLGTRLSAARSHMESLQVIAQHAGEYEDAKTRLSAYQRRLPLIKDKDEWLNFLITNSAKAYGISFEGMGAQKETEVGNFVVVSRDVSVTTNYATLGKWMADIENSPILIRIVELNMRRDQSNPGLIKVNFKLSTIIPKFQGGGS
jgi:type II secretory pathway component PulM